MPDAKRPFYRVASERLSRAMVGLNSPLRQVREGEITAICTLLAESEIPDAAEARRIAEEHADMPMILRSVARHEELANLVKMTLDELASAADKASADTAPHPSTSTQRFRDSFAQ